jgi:hypothetical protein
MDAKLLFTTAAFAEPTGENKAAAKADVQAKAQACKSNACMAAKSCNEIPGFEWDYVQKACFAASAVVVPVINGAEE